jgi:FkbM family methyltransferase
LFREGGGGYKTLASAPWSYAMSLAEGSCTTDSRTQGRSAAPAKSSGDEQVSDALAVPLLLGPLRGCWWQLASGGKVARLLLGTYEPEQSGLFLRHIHAGEQVLDIGAAAGYYTLLAARLVGPRGQVVAFEPDRANLSYLRAHVRANRLNQVTVLPLAVGAEHGQFRFGGGTGSGTGRLCDEGTHEVAVRRLDDLAAERGLVPRHVKIDVEGAELGVLQGGEQTIRRYRPTIFLSTHDWIAPGVHRACCALLESWRYRLQAIRGTSVERTSELLCVAE